MRVCVLLPALILAATSAAAQLVAVPAVPDDSIPSPVILGVEAYEASSPEDPQSYVIIRFEPVDSATLYRIWREIEVNYAPDESGELIPLDVPSAVFVPWASVDAIPGVGAMTVVIATLHDRRGRWGVSTEVVRDGTVHRSPISIFDFDPPTPTAVLQAGWGHIKNLAKQPDLRRSR